MTNLRHGQQQAKTALRVRADGVGVVVKLESLFGKRESSPEKFLSDDVLEPECLLSLQLAPDELLDPLLERYIGLKI